MSIAGALPPRALDPAVPHPAGGPACSTGSRLLGEAVEATAALGRRWLLVEIAGAWGYSAFTESPALDPATGAQILRRAEGAGLRVAAIRRPGRGRSTGRWRWATVDTRPGRESVRLGEADRPEQLLDLPLDGTAGTPSPRPLVLVCAHGRHDECCATRGLRATRAIARRHPDLTWEASHIGGDRFAATAILFPHGLSFGRVDTLPDPALIVDEYLAGRIAPDGFRGRTAFSAIEQAAQERARRLMGERGVDALPPILVDDADEGWLVTLAAPRALLRILVRRDEVGPLFTTCRSTRPVVVPRPGV